MPACYGISTTLESQYDIKQIQEYMLPTPSPSRSSRRNSKCSPSSGNSNSGYATEPAPKPPSPIEEVHVPIYPNSQFWLSYLVVPHLLQPAHPKYPSPDGEVKADKIKYVYFKLILPSSSTTSPPNTDDENIVNNRRNTTISWGVGAKEGWKGKTMFGLFKSSDDELAWSAYRGRSLVDKRGFWFSGDGTKEGSFEVQVFRARERRRESRVFPGLQNKKKEDRSEVVNLVNTGKLKGHQPQKYYQYALLDAMDDPYVTLRYHLRSMDNLTTMGIFPQPLLNPMTPRFYDPTNDETRRHKSSFRRTRDDDEESSVSSYGGAVEAQAYNDEGEDKGKGRYEKSIGEARQPAISTPEHFTGLSPSQSENRHSTSSPLHRNDGEAETDLTGKRNEVDQQTVRTNAFRRLLVPPTIRLVSSSSFNEPRSPSKDNYSDKKPIKQPFLRESTSPSDSCRHTNSTGNEECDIIHDINDKEDAAEVSTRAREADAIDTTTNIVPKTGEEVHHTLIKRVRAREGLEVARRNFILRTPSPITHPHTAASPEKSSEEKDKGRRQVTPPSSGRRTGGSAFLKGVLESALRRRSEKTEKNVGESRSSEEEFSDGRRERKKSGEENGKGERRVGGETKGIRSKYDTVRNSL